MLTKRRINRVLIEWPDQEKEVWDLAEGDALHLHEGRKTPWTHSILAFGCHFYFYDQEPKITLLDSKLAVVNGGLLSSTIE